ncbi:MAG: arginine--tRNA ligase, partial [Oscillospiraceae bacterium]|nr:arginine--tRNA ligase [Oscillospiraceae bacterium]
GSVTVSNRPDLCEYQCNGAMPAAKQAHKAPIMIAEDVAARLQGCAMFEKVEAVKPGFLNFVLAPAFVADYLNRMRRAEKFGLPLPAQPQTIVIDYGGPNVAKPLHVGHLRSAIIGESIKRIYRYFGNTVIGDIHMGDWGLQMGLIIEQVRTAQPQLPYFDASFTGDYPAEAPFTIGELEQIYPAASARAKQDADFAARAHDATFRLQQGDRGYTALWQHIIRISVADLKRNYAKLNVDFDVWKGESDADPYIQPMLAQVKSRDLMHESEGAMVVDVQEEADKKEIPPCILVKADGAALYATTDLATLTQRMQDYKPDKVLYVVDKRQGLHFEQVFRTARKAGIVPPETALQFLGFGTMNGADGKPFKTREGGVMRLEYLISEITQTVRKKVEENQIVDAAMAADTAEKVAMAALKYGDLSNQPSKDYIFDMERFSAFEGNTGPYLLYTVVRIKSILARYGQDVSALAIHAPENDAEKALMLALTRLTGSLQLAYRDAAPNTICAYLYELAGAVNTFYHGTRILQEPDDQRKRGYLALMELARRVMEDCMALLGFSAPEKM